jgi:hypothetical protein
MQTKKEKSKLAENLKDIILSDDSNIILPEVSFPSSYKPQPAVVGEVKYGAKSNEQKLASEHELLEYQKRVSRRDSSLTSEEIRNLVSETNERSRSLEQSINEQKQEFEQKRNAKLIARRVKEREEARVNRIAHENDTQRQMRLVAEEELKTNRAKELQTLENRRRREKEEVETFFLQSSNRFNEKYGYATKKISGETGIDRIVCSRTFSTNRYSHRCVPCGYHNPESLSIFKIYQHIFENRDSHMQYALSEIDKAYNPDLRQQKLSKELEQLQKLKGAKYR